MRRSQPSFWGSRRHTAAQQHARIKARFPQFELVGYGTKAAWLGRFEPRPGSVYKIRIEYGVAGTPKALLVDPEMREGCPHTYGRGQMCVYWPKDPDNPGWQEDSWIADTILPWSALWIHYYELWLETGEWLGPEASHAGPKE